MQPQSLFRVLVDNIMLVNSVEPDQTDLGLHWSYSGCVFSVWKVLYNGILWFVSASKRVPSPTASPIQSQRPLSSTPYQHAQSGGEGDVSTGK